MFNQTIFTKHDIADMLVRPLDGVTSPEIRERIVAKIVDKDDCELIAEFRKSAKLNLERISSNQFIITYN